MLTSPYLTFLIRLSVVLLGITGLLLFAMALSSTPLPKNTPTPDQVLHTLCLLFGLPLAIGMAYLYRFVRTSWDQAATRTKTTIALITLPPLPFLLYAAFWLIITLAFALFLLFCFASAGSSPCPSSYRGCYDGYGYRWPWHNHHHHHHPHCH